MLNQIFHRRPNKNYNLEVSFEIPSSYISSMSFRHISRDIYDAVLINDEKKKSECDSPTCLSENPSLFEWWNDMQRIIRQK